jgi:hypothetical protein
MTEHHTIGIPIIRTDEIVSITRNLNGGTPESRQKDKKNRQRLLVLTVQSEFYAMCIDNHIEVDPLAYFAQSGKQ